ncbi:MAG: hypothetical protein OEL55_01420 [Desulfobulbaceae bacterium]|nr:hypothetical protein [Desulfobulbaceae bacterium]
MSTHQSNAAAEKYHQPEQQTTPSQINISRKKTPFTNKVTEQVRMRQHKAASLFHQAHTIRKQLPQTPITLAHTT